ncbi:MAG TPA: sialidase family protein [bacterium]|nr:sialidase family protein [bacterium]HPP08061.1 sialidase family protein [bacterium]
MTKNRFLRLIDEGFVYQADPGTDHAVACGSRCVVFDNGEIACSFMIQSGLGINDFKPLLTYSKDGKFWQKPVLLWKEYLNQYSIFGSISKSPDGKLFFYGTRTKIDSRGESFWCQATQGLKENELVYAISEDNGRNWSNLFVIPKPFRCAAEAPGAMCITRKGLWHACFSPYNTFDPGLIVQRNQVVLLTSKDHGKSWQSTSMMKFPESYATSAEAWVIELADGKLLGTCWKLNQKDGTDFPNAYAISCDDGRTWKTGCTGIMGQSTALTPLDDGRAFFIYNQRKVEPYGVRLAVVRPGETSFDVLCDEPVYIAGKPAMKNSATGHSDWTLFSFGEPHAVVLGDRTILVVLWCIEPQQAGIRYLRFEASKLL